MTDDALTALAREAGISIDWRDAFDRPQRVAPDVLRRVLGILDLPAGSAAEIADSRARIEAERSGSTLPALVTARVGEAPALRLPPDARRWKLAAEDGAALAEGRAGEPLPAVDRPGYHRLWIDEAELELAVAPQRAFGVADAAGAGVRLAGSAAQLYSLRRDGGAGVGDFTALEEHVRALAPRGLDAMAISPVHAMFAAAPQRFSPYSPSSRLFLNTLYVDPARALGPDALARVLDDERRAAAAALEAADTVDWPGVAAHRLGLLRALHRQLADHATATEHFARWRAQAGEPLERHARFEALQLHFARVHGEVRGWQGWDAEFRDPASSAVAAFAAEHADEVGFHAWLQYLAARGLDDAQRVAREAGMAIGLIADLAVGSDPGGSQAWSHRDEMLQGVSVGAPPDLLNAQGQDWGLTTFSARGLRASGFAGFRAMLRAAFAHAGGARIDHILGLKRLWLVPHGGGANDGAYVDCPFEDLRRLIALESHRHRAIAIGEDLGTIPEGFGDTLAADGILGIRVLWFERNWPRTFLMPSQWSDQAMATTTTHDLPTAAGWWRGQDIRHRERLGLSEDPAKEYVERRADAVALWETMDRAEIVAGAPPEDWDGHPFARACAATIAATPAPLALLPLEDVLGLVEQPNLPGPTDAGHPNWRRRLPVDAAGIVATPIAQATLEALTQGRGRQGG